MKGIKLKGILGSIGRGISGLFRSKPTAPQVAPKRTIPQGHRGVAAGDLKERHRRSAEGEEPYTQEEIDKWQKLSGDEGSAFIYGGAILTVNSSNMDSAQFIRSKNQMIVKFLGGNKFYRVQGVSEQEAIDFVQAESKSGWYWDRILVRGKGNKGKTKKLVTPCNGFELENTGGWVSNLTL